MDEKLKSALDTKGKFHDNLLQYVKSRVEVSRGYMSKHYDLWDYNDETIRGERTPDDKDQRAAKRGEPGKLTLPFQYAQVHTMIAFFMMLFNQRSVFFDFEDNGEGDFTPEGDAEQLLDRDLTDSAFSAVQYQLFMDLARSGFCVIKSMWDEEQGTIKGFEPTAADPDFAAANLVDQSTTDKTSKKGYKRQGNKVVAQSPYKFFPDVRLPLSRFKEGEFCASEDEFSIVRLRTREKNGQIANVSDIVPYKAEGSGTRRLQNYMSDQGDSIRALSANVQGPGMAIVTEVQIWITPNDFKNEAAEGDAQTPFGTGDKPELYVIEYANDKTILRAEPLNYEHNEFCYDLGEFNPDQIRTINESLCELIDPLSQVSTWFLNSRVNSVRKVIDNRLVVDPEGVELDDLKARQPIIRLKPGVARSGVDTWIKQLEVQDVTLNHVKDIQVLWSFIQIVTGINDNALGQYNGGRRSASEARTVNAGAASRLKTVATVLWEKMFVPLGYKLLSNHAAYLDMEWFRRKVGATAQGIEERFARFKDNAQYMQFGFFDGTAPSEKGYIAQSMQDLLLGLMTNPMSAQMLTQEPFRSLVVEIADLRSIRSPERFLPPKQAIVPQEPIKPITNGPTAGGAGGQVNTGGTATQ
jgi:hypothetical protein